MFTRYDEKGKPIRKRVVVDCQKAIEDGIEIVLTEQSHRAEVDVNNIVKRHGMDLIQQTAALQELTYDNVPGNDFQEAMLMITKANETFEGMPSEIRKRFENDPAKFLDFVQDEQNVNELIEMGLAKPPEKEPSPIQVQVVNDYSSGVPGDAGSAEDSTAGGAAE